MTQKWAALPALLLTGIGMVSGTDLKVDLGKERVGRPPATLEPMVGTWLIGRMVARGDEGRFPLDRAAWHELKLTVTGAAVTVTIDGQAALDHTLGSEPRVGRRGPPHPDLFPANNPVLRPPVSGRIGLWSKTDSTSLFKDIVVTTEKSS